VPSLVCQACAATAADKYPAGNVLHTQDHAFHAVQGRRTCYRLCFKWLCQKMAGCMLVSVRGCEGAKVALPRGCSDGAL